MQPVLTTARSLSPSSPPQGAIIGHQRIQTELEKVFAREPWGKEVLPLVGPLALRSLQEIKGGKRPVAMSSSSGTAETADILMTPAWHACAHNGASPPFTGTAETVETSANSFLCTRSDSNGIEETSDGVKGVWDIFEGDRLNAISASGGILPLVGLVS
jgi:hypothetical protein